MNKTQNFVYLASARVFDPRVTDTETGYATSMKISEGVNMNECEHRSCVYFEVFHAMHSYICIHLLTVPLNAQCLFFTYILVFHLHVSVPYAPSSGRIIMSFT